MKLSKRELSQKLDFIFDKAQEKLTEENYSYSFEREIIFINRLLSELLNAHYKETDE